MSYLKSQVLERLQSLGVEPKKSMGQNFLISPHVIEKILALVDMESSKSIVEIGPGLGALTDELIKLGRPLLLLEWDRKFSEYWRAQNQNIVEGDALQFDWNSIDLPAPVLLVSNLPYQISASIVIDRSIYPGKVNGMILMFQKEVAKRLLAKPKTEDYGMLSVIAQTFWDVRNYLEAGPNDFYPPPKIASRVVQFRLRDFQSLEKNAILTETAEREAFLKLVKACFSQRRKMLVKSWGHPNAGEFLRNLGISEKVRAEELDPAQFLDLFAISKV